MGDVNLEFDLPATGVAGFGHMYGGPRLMETTVFKVMAEEVAACNREKGWYEVNPRVEEFMEWFAEKYSMVPQSFQDWVFDGVRAKVEELFGPRTFGDDVALLHSEVSEMLEAFRDHGTEDATQDVSEECYVDTCQKSHCSQTDGINLPEDGRRRWHESKPEGVGSEAADVLVRLLDTCSRYGIDLFAEWRRKVDYNWTRPSRHGGRRL